jgi:peptidoglycan/LPS O-acetylase OafA/YrhL
MVVVMHCPQAPSVLTRLDFLANGYYGVSIFFAISGFLITGTILDDYGSVASVDLRRFYLKRIGRILPCLALMILVLSALEIFAVQNFTFPTRAYFYEALARVATFTFNKYQSSGLQPPPGWAVLWSLSIEEMFYLLLPMTAILLRSERVLVAVLILVVINGLRDRTYHADLLSYAGTFDMIDMGALAAIAARRLKPRLIFVTPLRWGGLFLAFATYLFMPLDGHEKTGPSLVAGGTALALFANHFYASQSKVRFAVTAKIGECSYEIYLFHSIIFLLLAPAFSGAPWLNAWTGFLIALLVVFIFSLALRKLFSNPANYLIRSLDSKRSASSKTNIEIMTKTR